MVPGLLPLRTKDRPGSTLTLVMRECTKPERETVVAETLKLLTKYWGNLGTAGKMKLVERTDLVSSPRCSEDVYCQFYIPYCPNATSALDSNICTNANSTFHSNIRAVERSFLKDKWTLISVLTSPVLQG